MSFIKNLSVFIPRIHEEDANEEFIKNVFFSQEIASVRRVDLIKRTSKGKVYYNAKIHFHYWFKNQIAYNIQQRILLSETSGARIVYDDPWYWVILKNKNPMTENELRINERLEHIEKYMSEEKKKVKKAKRHIKHLSEQVKEQNQYLEELQREIYSIIEKNEKEYEDDSENTANACAEYVLKEENENRNDLDESLFDPAVLNEWNEYCVDVNEVKEYFKQIEKKNKCEGCVLLEQGLGGENQLGHTCLENNDFELLL